MLSCPGGGVVPEGNCPGMELSRGGIVLVGSYPVVGSCADWAGPMGKCTI